jgi:hypothetical protein
MFPGLLENRAEIIFKTINLTGRNKGRSIYLCHRPLCGLL